MNRRGFLAALGITVAGAASGLAIPELWTPKRTFFLPPKGGWAAQGWNPYTYQWTWLRGGSGIEIDSPGSRSTTFTPTGGRLTRDLLDNVAICTITDSAGHQQHCYLEVEFSRARHLVAMTVPSLAG